MKGFMKKAMPHICGVLGGFIGGGILATLLGEEIGYAFGFAYVYGLFGHTMVASLIEDKIK